MTAYSSPTRSGPTGNEGEEPSKVRVGHDSPVAMPRNKVGLVRIIVLMGNLLVDLFPELSAELEQLLFEQGESELARQVSTLSVVDRCRCGDDFCSTFYALPKPDGAYGPRHRNVSLAPQQGMLILDVVAERIAAVEVLFRDAVRRRLIIEFP